MASFFFFFLALFTIVFVSRSSSTPCSHPLLRGELSFFAAFAAREYRSVSSVGHASSSWRSCPSGAVQECACNHAQSLWGLGQSMPAGMLSENLAWVCTRLHVMVDEYPRWGDQVEVNTWFEAQGRIAVSENECFARLFPVPPRRRRL